MRKIVTIDPTTRSAWTMFRSFECDEIQFQSGAIILINAVGLTGPDGKTYGWNPSEPLLMVIIPTTAIHYAEVKEL